MNLLDFEEPIGKLQEQLESLKKTELESDVKMTQAIEDVENKIQEKREAIFSNLTAWQRVQVSRFPVF